MTKKVLIIGTEQSKCHEDIELSNCLAKKYLKDFLGYEIIQKTSPERLSVKHGKLVGIANTLKLMADADLVYVTRYWQDSTACSLEVQAAKSFRIEIIYEENVVPDSEFKESKTKKLKQIPTFNLGNNYGVSSLEERMRQQYEN